MTRWDELIRILKSAGVTERQVAMAVSELLNKGRGKDPSTVDLLQRAIAGWRAEDRAAEEV